MRTRSVGFVVAGVGMAALLGCGVCVLLALRRCDDVRDVRRGSFDYREGPSLSGLLAAVRAGLAVTLRVARHAQKGLHAVGSKEGLPAVGSFRLALVTADPPSPATRALCAALRTTRASSPR